MELKIGRADSPLELTISEKGYGFITIEKGVITDFDELLASSVQAVDDRGISTLIVAYVYAERDPDEEELKKWIGKSLEAELEMLIFASKSAEVKNIVKDLNKEYENLSILCFASLTYSQGYVQNYSSFTQ